MSLSPKTAGSSLSLLPNSLYVLQCCLGMDFLNPNISGEMAQLLLNNQEKYVPIVQSDQGCKKVVTPIPLIGDQLFEERARNVKWTFQNGDNDIDCIKGLRSEFADWHAKVTLYEVCIFTKHMLINAAP